MNEYNRWWCLKVWNELTRMAISKPFRNPVDPVNDDAPDYFKKIKQPMDFTKIKQNLVNNVYTTPEQFVSDVHLISSNTKLYNGKDSYYAACADIIDDYVDSQYKEKCTSYDEEWDKNLDRAIRELREHIYKAPKIHKIAKLETVY